MDNNLYNEKNSIVKNNKNKNKNNKNKKIIVIGIGGISRTGKSTLTNNLKKKLNIINTFHIDNYIISPIKKYDENIKDYIEDWEDPICYNLNKFYEDLKEYKINSINNFINDNNELNYIIAEGFLLYNKKEITELIDIKINYIIDKEIARYRRKSTKYYGSDYYFNEYIWKCYFENK
jgi:nicotinamide/nicotinate riboside kinase